MEGELSLQSTPPALVRAGDMRLFGAAKYLLHEHHMRAAVFDGKRRLTNRRLDQ
jgi:hypothetical protein